MKKGDIIQRRHILPAKSVLLGNLESQEIAAGAFNTIWKHWNLPRDIKLGIQEDEKNFSRFAVVLEEDSYEIQEARVNWIVDNEAALEFPSGGCQIVDVVKDGWIVIKESQIEYQTSVEHMSDEVLRESINALRSQRVSQPSKVRRVSSLSSTTQKESPEDRKISAVLKNKTPEEIQELQRKLGLID